MWMQDRILITQITQPLHGSYSTFRYHNPGPTTCPRGMPQLGRFTQWITSISRASLAQGNGSLVLLNSSSIDRDLATSPQPCPCSSGPAAAEDEAQCKITSITQIMQPLCGSHSPFRYHNPGATTSQGNATAGHTSQWITHISRGSLARGIHLWSS
jgi:hypothetical protein